MRRAKLMQQGQRRFFFGQPFGRRHSFIHRRRVCRRRGQRPIRIFELRRPNYRNQCVGAVFVPVGIARRARSDLDLLNVPRGQGRQALCRAGFRHPVQQPGFSCAAVPTAVSTDDAKLAPLSDRLSVWSRV